MEDIAFLEIVERVQNGDYSPQEKNAAWLAPLLLHFLPAFQPGSDISLGGSDFQYFMLNTPREFSQCVGNWAAYIFRKLQQLHDSFAK